MLPGCGDHAKQVGGRLKDRIFHTILPHLAQGFLFDRRQRLALASRRRQPPDPPTKEELADLFDATHTLLFRLLFLLYAESRSLLPIREAPYHAASLTHMAEEIAAKAGMVACGVAECLYKAYSHKEVTLYGRLTRLFRAIDRGDPTLNTNSPGRRTSEHWLSTSSTTSPWMCASWDRFTRDCWSSS
jgi:hypothetical protein